MEKRIVHKKTKISDDMDDEQTKADGLTSSSRVLSLRKKRKKNDNGNINGIRKEQKMGVKTVEQEVELVDTISELPEPVIHHILSFLRSPKEAARTSILSKKWRDIWKSFSVLKFDERFFHKTEVDLGDKRRQMFVDFIDNSLQSHLTQNLGIYKLVLRITSKTVPNLKQWVEVAGANGLSELDIHVEFSRQRYKVPPFMNSIKTLTGLRLQGLNCSSFEVSVFPNLQKLYLQKLQVDQQIIQQLVSNCPLLVDLRIIKCRGLKNLQISGFQKLERVDLYQCHGLKTIEFQVTSLKTFWYCAKKSSCCKLNLESCTSLKRLTLEDPSMTDNFLNKLLFNFPILEKLNLSRCNKFKHIEISNVKLRSLGLRSCERLKLVDIDTLTPCSLDYTGNHMVSVLGRLHLNEAKFSVTTKKKDGEFDSQFQIRNINIQCFLQGHCKGYKIAVWFLKMVIIYDENQKVFLPPLPNLKLHVIKPSTDAKVLLDNLLTKGHPERIYVSSSPSSEVLKALREIGREADPSCCSYLNSKRKCWRHFLKDASIKNEGGCNQDFQGWLDCFERTTHMRLDWEASMHLGKVLSDDKKDSDSDEEL